MIVPKSEHSKMAKRVVPKTQKSAIKYASQRRIEVMTGMLNSPISWRWELGQLSECDEARVVTFRAAMHEGECSLLKTIFFLFTYHFCGIFVLCLYFTMKAQRKLFHYRVLK